MSHMQYPKSVHITNYYHKNSGGVSTSYNNLLAAAARWKREVRLIVPGESEAVEIVNDFAKIYYVPAGYSPVFDKRYRIILPWQYMLRNSLIRRILAAEQPDLIEVTDKYTLSMIGAMIRIGKFKAVGRPALVHFSCERMDDNLASFLTAGKHGAWFARQMIGNYTLPSYDYHIANSTYTANEFFQANSVGNRPSWLFKKTRRMLRAPRIPLAERVFVCPRGVDTLTFTPNRLCQQKRMEMRERANVPAESTLLLYAGRLSPEKNVRLLIDLMKILAKSAEGDVRLLVAGDGPLSGWLKAETDKHLPGKIIHLGHLDKETLADHYANADVFVHPNPKEPFGIAPLEAMASGVATVAPNSGGILTYASQENAWLVDPTADEFASAICQIVSDPELRERKIASALATARVNTREAATDRLFETYDKINGDFCKRRDLFTDFDSVQAFDYGSMEIFEASK